MRGRGKLIAVAIFAVAGMLQTGTGPAGAGGPPPGTPQTTVPGGAPGQSFSFGLWGDVPYIRSGDAPRMAALLQDLNRAPLAFSVFDGDIKDGSSLCTEDHYAGAIERFNTLAAPLVYVPGDNEWTDCHRTDNGGDNNLERLAHPRRTMFPTAHSFGQRRLVPEPQGPPGGAYVETTRWAYGDVVFTGLNVPGSNNNRVGSPAECTRSSARTPADCDADNAEYAARDAADVEWLRQTFGTAEDRQAKGVVVIIQADPGFDVPETDVQ
jgi:hypothetical protein